MALTMNSVLSSELTRFEVEKIAFDPMTKPEVAERYKHILNTADNMMNGTDWMCNGYPGRNIPSYRILFIQYPDGLFIWFD